jgi:probable addiction module antidote protein
MAEEFLPYDPADVLISKATVEVFLSDAFDTGNAKLVAAALRVVARSAGMKAMAWQVGVAPTQLEHLLRFNDSSELAEMLLVTKQFSIDIGEKLPETCSRPGA